MNLPAPERVDLMDGVEVGWACRSPGARMGEARAPRRGGTLRSTVPTSETLPVPRGGMRWALSGERAVRATGLHKGQVPPSEGNVPSGFSSGFSSVATCCPGGHWSIVFYEVRGQAWDTSRPLALSHSLHSSHYFHILSFECSGCWFLKSDSLFLDF